jgi:hypothetical protein
LYKRDAGGKVDKKSVKRGNRKEPGRTSAVFWGRKLTSFHPPLSFSKAPGPEAAADASCVLEEGDEEDEGCGCCCWRFQRGEEEAVEGDGVRMTKAVVLKEGSKEGYESNERGGE